MTINITLSDGRSPVSKVADAELVFTADEGPLEGLKLIGFGVWESPTKKALHVTFPARAYSVNGERRSFALLRPTGAGDTAAGRAELCDLILDCYRQAVAAMAETPRA